MRRYSSVIIAGILLLPGSLTAQRNRAEEGFELGSIWFRPVADALAAYDNDVIRDVNDDPQEDIYSEAAASLSMGNIPAIYDFSASAGYGYRFYNEYSELNDDFYQAGLSVGTDVNPLQYDLSAYIKKTLDYDSAYEESTGEGLPSILTKNTSTRYVAKADVAYENYVSDKTSISPGYDYQYYFQELEQGDDAEWQIHRAGLQLGYRYTEKTRLYLTGYYSLQINENEDGKLGAVEVGASGRFSDKTSWLAHLGVATADYDLSGTDQGLVGLLRMNWDISDKLNAYIFGRSDFEPGFGGGGARRVYRLGYGATWFTTPRWSQSARLFHDYQEEISTSSGSDGALKNFATVQSDYDLTGNIAVGARIRYIVEEDEEDQIIASLTASYRY